MNGNIIFIKLLCYVIPVGQITQALSLTCINISSEKTKRQDYKFIIAIWQRDVLLCCMAFIKADSFYSIFYSIVAEQIATLFK